MQKLTCSEIVKAVKGTLICGSMDTVITNISTDSRKIAPGDLFIPLEGERFDGHDFITGSLEKGALAALTHKDARPLEGKALIKVDDTSRALKKLAAYYRSKYNIPFVGITGSVGKTSTKDMIASVLAQEFKVLKTEGNFNNEIGLPLTMFNLDNTHQAAVIEMGMSGFGEISRLTAITKPHIAVITNIGISHIEKLGSRQNILKAKMEIFEGLDSNGLVVLNGDDKLLYGLKDLLKFKTVFYGINDNYDYQAFNVHTVGETGVSFEIAIGNTEYKIHIPVPGVHNVYNALAAVAVGIELGLPMDKIVQGIGTFTPSKMRMNVISYKAMKIIDDAYNASPQSMEAAISVLRDMGMNRRTIAVLGDMLEMGDWAPKAHYDIGKFAVSKHIDYIITVGKNGRSIAQGAAEAGAGMKQVFSFENNSEAGRFLENFVQENDVILIKGSRGMKMEEIIHQLTSNE